LDNPTKLRKQFENDIQRLRDWGVELEHYDGQYHLITYGDFNPVSLPERALDDLAFLTEIFGPDAPRHDQVQKLLQTILDWLHQAQRDTVSTRRQRLQMDLRRRDTDRIHPRVQFIIDKAVGKQELRFDYLSPGQEDGVPRRHTVQPWRQYFDTMRGHLYLEAYRLQVEGPHGVWTKKTWQRYRLGRIQPDAIEVLPDRLPPEPPRRPRHRLEYLLSPKIARGGDVTRHFDDMEVHEPNADGWVQVTATTGDLFRATRLLLKYGPNCEVIGGREARREMESLVHKMAELYEVTEK
jgi:predicted DNA-binding transcriptional regulator YafY